MANERHASVYQEDLEIIQYLKTSSALTALVKIGDGIDQVQQVNGLS